MIEVDGVKVASPAYDHQVKSLSDMVEGVLYPTSCFAHFTISRGRNLGQALCQDPSAPDAITVSRAKCFTVEQVRDYLAGYGDDFIDATSEVALQLAALRKSDELALKKKFAEIEAEKEQNRLDMETAVATMSDRLKTLVQKFIADHSSDVTKAANSICGIYFLRKGREIVYIGQSVNVYSRIASHKASKDFDTVDFMPCDRSKLDDLEGFFIRLLQPKLNGHLEGTIHGAPKSAIWGDIVSLPWLGPRM